MNPGDPVPLHSLRDVTRWPRRGIITGSDPPMEWVHVGLKVEREGKLEDFHFDFIVPPLGKKIALPNGEWRDAATVFPGVDAIAWGWGEENRITEDRLEEIRDLYIGEGYPHPIPYELDPRRNPWPVLPAPLLVELHRLFVVPRKARREEKPSLSVRDRERFDAAVAEIKREDLHTWEELAANGRRVRAKKNQRKRPRASVVG